MARLKLCTNGDAKTHKFTVKSDTKEHVGYKPGQMTGGDAKPSELSRWAFADMQICNFPELLCKSTNNRKVYKPTNVAKWSKRKGRELI
ncbi:uncharacterized protein RCO7_11670 [Rhynchosporium graminicola]|uniref:Uncharacterized protein n=1 Tax=Rhynchosporium graminicola TaxID=2792576 RepID=A0A1E1LB27_9HELO|nr:uncharacterized protein RCO7_11670 [Rhynchosporium commune]